MTADAVGGVWTFALELARGLAAEDIEVLLAVVGPAPDGVLRAEATTVPGLSLVITGLGLEWQDRAGPLDAPARDRLLTLERDFSPDLVHCNGFREAAAGFAAPVVLVAHSCVGTWWRSCRNEPLPKDWHAYASGVRVGLRSASVVVGPTESFLDAFLATWGPVPRRCVVRNGLDLEPVAPARHRPVVLAAGRLWDEAKNIEALAAVAPELPWPVLVAGEPPPQGLDRRVSHLGRLPRAALRQAMAEAAIFAAPARYEPFGLAILEAAAASCALVLGRTPSLLELWGDAARFVPVDDPAGLRDALLDLIEDRAALALLQEAARTRAARFNRAAMVAGYREVYADALHAKVRAA
jgi:glycosyltransferase involved in cell wall biosynthesis